MKYTYDAWGNILTVTGGMANTLGKANPLRYRGYIYDEETRLYYLQSRYYDPEIGRFINADIYTSTGQGFIGNNMFAYCNNNPTNNVDDSGNLPQAVTDKIVHNAVLGKIVAQQPDLSMVKTCVYYNGNNILNGFGYCDLFHKSTGEVWELKKASDSWSCLTVNAQAQLEKYTSGKLKHYPQLELKVACETQIPGGSFSFTKAGYIYQVSNWSENNGILRYTYNRTETDGYRTAKAVATVFAVGVLLYTNPYALPIAGAIPMLS